MRAVAVRLIFCGEHQGVSEAASLVSSQSRPGIEGQNENGRSTARAGSLVRLLRDIAIAANEARSVDEAFAFALGVICEFSGWKVGHAFVKGFQDDEHKVRVVLGPVEDPFSAIRRATVEGGFDPLTGLPGRVFASGQAEWIADVRADPRFIRNTLAGQLEVGAGIAFPVLVESDVVAVMEFFAAGAESPDDGLLETMVAVGTQLGRVVERNRVRQMIMDRDRKLVAAQRIAGLGYWEWSPITGKLHWTDELYRLYGLNPGEHIDYEEYIARIHEDDRELVTGTVGRAMQEHDPFYMVHRIVTPTGEVRYIQGDGTVDTDGNGNVIRMSGTALDVTRIMTAELELRASEERYRLLAENATDMVVRSSTDGVFIYVSPSSESVVGYGSDELVSKPVYDFVHPDDLDAVRRMYREVLDATAVQTIAYRFSRKSGGYVWVESTLRSVSGDGEAVAEIVSSTRDITERRTAEARLRHFEERTKALTESAVEAIVMIDDSGTVVGWNESATRIFGYERDEVMGGPLSPIMPERYREAHRKALQRVLVTFESRLIGRTIELEGRRKSGEEFPVELSLSMWEADGTRYFGGIIRDISVRKQVEEELVQKTQQLRLLAARIQKVREEERTRLSREVHDVLGQALTGLRMDVAMLERGGMNGEVAQERLDIMKNAIDETVRIVRRISSDLRPGVLDDLGIEAALEWEVQKFEGRTGIACTFIDHTDGVTLDEGRSTAAFRVFQELLTNVARHAKAGTVEVQIRSDDSRFVIEVQDDGVGIDQERAKRGLSLGILGMRERLAPWGGEVEFRGSPGAGTRVTVSLPISNGSIENR